MKGLFGARDKETLAAKSLVSKLLASDSINNDKMIDQLMELGEFKVIEDAEKIVSTQKEELINHMKKIYQIANESFPAVSSINVHRVLIDCYSMIRKNPNQRFLPETPELRDMESLQRLNRLANELVPLAIQEEKLRPIISVLSVRLLKLELQNALDVQPGPSSSSVYTSM